MLVLLAMLAVGCTTFWMQRTVCNGSLFKWFDKMARTNIAHKLVLDRKDHVSYAKGIACFVAGQGTAYMTNLVFTTLSEEQVSLLLQLPRDPLSLYLSIMIPDDIIGSMFRFGMWSKMFSTLQECFQTNHRSLISRNKPEGYFAFFLTQQEMWLDGDLFLIHIFYWCVQVFCSVTFSFTVSSSLFMLGGQASPSGSLFRFFSSMDYDCTEKVINIAVPIRFGLEAIHALLGPPLIRYLSSTNVSYTRPLEQQ